MDTLHPDGMNAISTRFIRFLLGSRRVPVVSALASAYMTPGHPFRTPRRRSKATITHRRQRHVRPSRCCVPPFPFKELTLPSAPTDWSNGDG
jgi:hypothetical protein